LPQDDLLIRAEGLDSLTDDELRSASKARGMKAAFGEGARDYMRRQMQVRCGELRMTGVCWSCCMYAAWRWQRVCMQVVG
jgi:hypothetical protein